MKNSEITEKIKGSGFYLYQVADEIGVSDVTLRKWLRSERDTSRQPVIMAAVERLKEGATNE